jgi:hypothetical protein
MLAEVKRGQLSAISRFGARWADRGCQKLNGKAVHHRASNGRGLFGVGRNSAATVDFSPPLWGGQVLYFQQIFAFVS